MDERIPGWQGGRDRPGAGGDIIFGRCRPDGLVEDVLLAVPGHPHFIRQACTSGAAGRRHRERTRRHGAVADADEVRQIYEVRELLQRQRRWPSLPPRRAIAALGIQMEYEGHVTRGFLRGVTSARPLPLTHRRLRQRLPGRLDRALHAAEPAGPAKTWRRG